MEKSGSSLFAVGSVGCTYEEEEENAEEISR